MREVAAELPGLGSGESRPEDHDTTSGRVNK
jgi:hypothetical protein